MTIDELAQRGVILMVEYNEHKMLHRTAAEEIDVLENDLELITLEDVSAAERERMIETDSIWQIRIYPITPIGFYEVYAPTYDEAMQKIAEALGEE